MIAAAILRVFLVLVVIITKEGLADTGLLDPQGKNHRSPTKEMSASKKVKKSSSKDDDDDISPAKKISKKESSTQSYHPTSGTVMTAPPTVAPTCLECDDGIALTELMMLNSTLNMSSSNKVEGRTVSCEPSHFLILLVLVVLSVVGALLKKMASMLLNRIYRDHPQVEPITEKEDTLNKGKIFEDHYVRKQNGRRRFLA